MKSNKINNDTSFQSEQDFLKEQFIKYLKEYEIKDSVINLSLKINWKTLIQIFDQEYSLLWNSFIVPKNLEISNKHKLNFRFAILNSIKEKLFHSLYILLIKLNSENLSSELLENKIEKFQSIFIKDMVSVFVYQYNLTSLAYNNDSNILIPKIKELHKKAEQGTKFLGKKNRGYEIPVFKLIIEEYNSENNKDLKLSLRSIAFRLARTNLDYLHTKEQESFYKRFNTYKNKKK